MVRSQTPPAVCPPSIEIVARALGLDVGVFKQLMTDRKITTLCERGTGTDNGRYRASFYYGNRRVRLVVDEDGRALSGPA